MKAIRITNEHHAALVSLSADPLKASRAWCLAATAAASASSMAPPPRLHAGSLSHMLWLVIEAGLDALEKEQGWEDPR